MNDLHSLFTDLWHTFAAAMIDGSESLAKTFNRFIYHNVDQIATVFVWSGVGLLAWRLVTTFTRRAKRKSLREQMDRAVMATPRIYAAAASRDKYNPSR